MSFKDIFFKKSPFASHNSSHSDASDNYKEWLKSQEVKKAKIDSLQNSLNSQKLKQASYDKKLSNYQNMTKDLKSWSEKAKKSEIGNYDFAVEDVIKGKVDGNYFYFKDKDKSKIAITGGDAASNDKDWFATNYYTKPEGERPIVDPKTKILLEENKKSLEQEKSQGFKEKPTEKIIKNYEVYTGPRYNPKTGKIEKYTTTAQFRANK